MSANPVSPRKRRREDDDDADSQGPSEPKNSGLSGNTLARLTAFRKAVDDMETALRPYMQGDFETHMQRAPMELIRADLASLFAINTLAYSVLSTKGINAAENVDLKRERERVKEYMARLKAEEERRQFAPTLQKRVATSLVRNALYELPAEKARHGVEPPVEKP